MNLYFENETDYAFPFDAEEVAAMVIEKVLEVENVNLVRLKYISS